MADPVTVDHFRVMAVWQKKSGLPEDVLINSFVFRNQNQAGPLGGGLEERIRTALDEFYFGRTTDVDRISAYMRLNSFVGLSYKIYDLADTPPRPPHTLPSVLFGTAAGSNAIPLPEEVSVTVSWLSDTRGPRGRGRTFLGGLTTSCVDVDSETNETRVAQAFRDTVAFAGAVLLGDNNQDVELMVLGLDGSKRITHGYVDDAFDTQRRRGTAPQVRSTFDIAGV